MRNKLYYSVLVVGIGFIIFSMVKDYKGRSNVADLDDVKNQKQEELNGGQEVADKNYLEGVLYKSDEPNRGNFKLSSNDGDIYLKTSRDFSALIGLQVLVLIDGTIDNFQLVDVQSKVAKDGFILNQ